MPPLAAHLVEAVDLARRFVVPGLDELAGRSWMRCEYNIFGRPWRSSSGNFSNVAMYVTTAVMTSGIGGQPGTLMIGLSLMTL